MRPFKVWSILVEQNFEKRWLVIHFDIVLYEILRGNFDEW